MPFGKFSPAKTEIVKSMSGQEITVNTPAGYSGIFWGTVYDSDETPMTGAYEYFMALDDLDTDCLDRISDLIYKHTLTYIDPYCGEHHHYQSGFGGDENDGLIDFWTENSIPEMPDMPFEVAGRQYVLKWDYPYDE
jgi:hypothetical protein